MEGSPSPTSTNREAQALKTLVLAAILLRLICAIPGLLDNSLLMRPDSVGYIQQAQSLLKDFAFNTSPGSGVPELMRTPGYPFYLACLFALGGNALCVIVSTFLAGLVCIPVHLCGRELFGWKAGIAGAALFALNPTAIAMGPLFLSDSLFVLIVALQLLFMIKFMKGGGLRYALLCGAMAGIGALVRPLNIYWLAPGIVAGMLALQLPIKRRLAGCALMALVACSLTVPWVVRNKLVADWPCLSNMTGDQLLLFNGAILESAVTGERVEDVRTRFSAESEREFASNPGKYSTDREKSAYKTKRFAEILKAHPLRYALLHLRPYMIIPDIASLAQNIGLTQGEKGTFFILTRDGPLAAMKHYFGGNYWPIALFAPLLFAVGLCYALSGCWLCVKLYEFDIPALALFVAFPAFYLLIPGPVAMPRYQLPALPLLCAMAGAGAVWLVEKYKSSKIV